MCFRVPADGSPSETVVEAVSECESTDPMALPPLAEAIDTDALDAIFETDRSRVTLSFRYSAVVVTVTAGESTRVRVRPLEQPSDE